MKRSESTKKKRRNTPKVETGDRAKYLDRFRAASARLDSRDAKAFEAMSKPFYPSDLPSRVNTNSGFDDSALKPIVKKRLRDIQREDAAKLIQARKLENRQIADFWRKYRIGITSPESLYEHFSKKFPSSMPVCKSSTDGRLFPVVESGKRSYVVLEDGEKRPVTSPLWSRISYLKLRIFLFVPKFSNQQLATVYLEHRPGEGAPLETTNSEPQERQSTILYKEGERRSRKAARGLLEKAMKRSTKPRSSDHAIMMLTVMYERLSQLGRPKLFSFVEEVGTKNLHPIVPHKAFQVAVLRDGSKLRIDKVSRFEKVFECLKLSPDVGLQHFSLPQLSELLIVTRDRLNSAVRAQQQELLRTRRKGPTVVRKSSLADVPEARKSKTKKRKKKRSRKSEDAMGYDPKTGRPRWVRGF